MGADKRLMRFALFLTICLSFLLTITCNARAADTMVGKWFTQEDAIALVQGALGSESPLLAKKFSAGAPEIIGSFKGGRGPALFDGLWNLFPGNRYFDIRLTLTDSQGAKYPTECSIKIRTSAGFAADYTADTAAEARKRHNPTLIDTGLKFAEFITTLGWTAEAAKKIDNPDYQSPIESESIAAFARGVKPNQDPKQTYLIGRCEVKNEKGVVVHKKSTDGLGDLFRKIYVDKDDKQGVAKLTTPDLGPPVPNESASLNSTRISKGDGDPFFGRDSAPIETPIRLSHDADTDL